MRAYTSDAASVIDELARVGDDDDAILAVLDRWLQSAYDEGYDCGEEAGREAAWQDAEEERVLAERTREDVSYWTRADIERGAIAPEWLRPEVVGA